MKLGEKGSPIIARVDAEINKVVENGKNIEYFEDLCSTFKEM